MHKLNGMLLRRAMPRFNAVCLRNRTDTVIFMLWHFMVYFMDWHPASVTYHRLSIDLAEWDITFKILSACVFL